jgi:hypothetical protein
MMGPFFASVLQGTIKTKTELVVIVEGLKDKDEITRLKKVLKALSGMGSVGQPFIDALGFIPPATTEWDSLKASILQDKVDARKDSPGFLLKEISEVFRQKEKDLSPEQAVVMISQSDHDIPWTILSALVNRQLERSESESDLYVNLHLSWMSPKSASYIIPLLRRVLDSGITVRICGFYDSFQQDRDARHGGFIDLYSEFMDNPLFEFYKEYRSHSKLFSDNYSDLMAGGNYTKTVGESNGGNEVICLIYGKAKETSTHSIISTPSYKGTVNELVRFMKESRSTIISDNYFNRRNYTQDDYGILDSTLAPLQLFDMQKNIVISYLRCPLPFLIVLASMGVGKTRAAMGVLLQIISEKPKDSHTFYYATDSTEGLDQLVDVIREFCHSWNIQKYMNGSFESVHRAKRNSKVTIYLSTHAALLRKISGSDNAFNNIAKGCSLCIFDEFESPVDAPILGCIVNLFNRVLGMTGTLVGRDVSRFQVDLIATAEDCVLAKRTVPTRSFILHKTTEFDPLPLLVKSISGKFFLFASDADEYNRVFGQLSVLDGCEILKSSSHETVYENSSSLASFRASVAKTTIMVLIKKFVRGISVSDLSGVINLSASKSVSNIAQKAGRAIRLHDGKNFASFYQIVDVSKS